MPFSRESSQGLNSGIEPRSPALQVDYLPSKPPKEAKNWRLTEPKSAKMMLVKSPMINLKMTIRADSTISACSPLPLSIKFFPTDCQLGGCRRLDRHLPPTPVAGIWNKANFPFHKPGLFIVFWVTSSQTQLLVTEVFCEIASIPPRW